MIARILTMALAATAALTGQAASAPRAPVDSDVGSVSFQVDPAHDGRIVFPNGFKAPLKQKWLRKVDNTNFTYPLVANGLVFIIGLSEKTYLYAFDLASGDLVWKKPVKSNHPPYAVYDNGRVFVVTWQGLVTAYGADRTGAQLWSVKLKAHDTGYWTPPVASGGHLVIDGSATPPNGAFFCLKEEDGSVEWLNVVDGGAGVGPPAIAEDAVFVAHPFQVHKFDLATGKTIWYADWHGDGGGSRAPAYFKNRLYTRDPGATGPLAYETRKGKVVGPMGSVHPPAFWTAPNGKSYQIIVDDHRYLAVDLATDNVVWSFRGDGFVATAPLIVNDVIIAGSMAGNLYAIDAATGKELWETAPGFVFGPPDEQNGPLTGFGAGGYTLVLPSGPNLVAYVQDTAAK